MTYITIFLSILIVLMGQSVTEDLRSIKMSIMTGWQFQCANTTCLPFATVIASNIRKCQIACLAQIHCQAASFQQSMFNCGLFAYISNQNGIMLTNANTVTMFVMSGTRIPPEPTTTSTTTSTTSTTTTTTSTTATTTSTPYPPCSRSYCCTYQYPTPCTYSGHICNCDDGGGGQGTFFCSGCAGPGPADYSGSGTCYYGGYYYSGC